MSGRWWRAYLIVAVLAVLGYQLLPDGVWLPAAWQVGIAYLAALAALLGSRKLPRAERSVWLLIAVAVAGNASGILANAYLATYDPGAAQPNLADPFFLSLYPCAGLALALSLRLHPPLSPWPAVLDSATVTSGIGLLAWIFTIDSAIHDQNTALAERLVRVSYPIGDILLLTLAAVLIRSAPAGRVVRHRNAAPWLLLAVLVFLAGDLIWLVDGTLGLDLEGVRALSRGVDSVFLCAFLTFGYAVRRASTDIDLSALLDVERTAGGRRRGIVGLACSLGAALLITPALLLSHADDDMHDTVAIALGAMVTTVLVVTRMALLLGTSARQESYVRELSRRDELTGLPNRRAWNAELARALIIAAHGRPPRSPSA